MPIVLFPGCYQEYMLLSLVSNSCQSEKYNAKSVPRSKCIKNDAHVASKLLDGEETFLLLHSCSEYRPSALSMMPCSK